jgi:hypothetical protein
MSDQQKSGDTITATITGDVDGQVAVGKDISQSYTTAPAPPEAIQENAEAVDLPGRLRTWLARQGETTPSSGKHGQDTS